MYTLRHFLFYMGMSAFAGALLGIASKVMDWSIGLIYGVGLSVGIAIVLFAMREGLFGSSPHTADPDHRQHA